MRYAQTILRGRRMLFNNGSKRVGYLGRGRGGGDSSELDGDKRLHPYHRGGGA